MPLGASSVSGTRWRRVAGSLVRRTPTSLVVAVPASTAPVRIEGAAACVWESLDLPRGIDDVVAVIAHDGDFDVDVLAGEVARTLDALAAAGLVESL
ncbi:MAG: hypothetical protein ACXVQ7_12885 [Actinomycetota bacterium]